MDEQKYKDTHGMLYFEKVKQTLEILARYRPYGKAIALYPAHTYARSAYAMSKLVATAFPHPTIRHVNALLVTAISSTTFPSYLQLH
jgi:hypothetical protein